MNIDVVEINKNKPSALILEGLFMTIHNAISNDDFLYPIFLLPLIQPLIVLPLL